MTAARGPCAYLFRGRGCSARAVITWESKSAGQYATGGSCRDPQHAAHVQAWVARKGGGPVRVIAGDLDAVLPDPDGEWSLFDGMDEA